MEHNQTIGIAETFFPPKLSPISSTAIPQWSWLIWMEISFKIVCSPILELLFHVQNIPNGLTLWSIGASFSGHIYLHRQFRACREVRLLFAWHQDLAKGHPYASQCLSLIRSPTRIMILSCDQIYVLCDDWSKFLYPGTAILREKKYFANLSQTPCLSFAGPCWATTPLIKIQSSPATSHKIITDNFFIAL